MLGLIVGSNGRIGNVVYKTMPRDRTFVISAADLLRLTNAELTTLGIDIAKKNVKWVMNCAGYTEMDCSKVDSQLSRKLNLEIVEKLITICDAGAINLLHLSSDLCNLGQYSNAPKLSSDLYGHYKKCAESIIVESDVASLIVRFGWPYHMSESWIQENILRGQRDEVVISCADDARHPTDIDDLANLFLYLLNSCDSVGSEVINIGSPFRFYKGDYIYQLIQSNMRIMPKTVVCESRCWSKKNNKTSSLPDGINYIERYGGYIFQNKIINKINPRLH